MLLIFMVASNISKQQLYLFSFLFFFTCSLSLSVGLAVNELTLTLCNDSLYSVIAIDT